RTCRRSRLACPAPRQCRRATARLSRPPRPPARLPICVSSSVLPCCSGLIREWPDPEVIADIAPQPVQPLRLHNQEENDQAAEQDQAQIGNGILQILLREQEPAVILKKPAGQDRQQGNEDGTENRAEN